MEPIFSKPIKQAEGETVVFWILGKGFVMRLIKCTLGSGKPREGWEFGGEGTREQWGTRGAVYKQPGNEVEDSYHKLEGAK
jgi:hypothetical protein